mmetsp:Transcript_128312/g.363105  ORF Transcript_128312/g.363105 Transcript_128312/m.363105 type:complete len:215 (+) Transcript_128312:88-732(+)
MPVLPSDASAARGDAPRVPPTLLVQSSVLAGLRHEGRRVPLPRGCDRERAAAAAPRGVAQPGLNQGEAAIGTSSRCSVGRRPCSTAAANASQLFSANVGYSLHTHTRGMCCPCARIAFLSRSPASAAGWWQRAEPPMPGGVKTSTSTSFAAAHAKMWSMVLATMAFSTVRAYWPWSSQRGCLWSAAVITSMLGASEFHRAPSSTGPRRMLTSVV